MLQLLLTLGLAVVCAASLLESLGAPVPAFPVLWLAGSVATDYRFSAVPLVVASAGRLLDWGSDRVFRWADPRSAKTRAATIAQPLVDCREARGVALHSAGQARE